MGGGMPPPQWGGPGRPPMGMQQRPPMSGAHLIRMQPMSQYYREQQMKRAGLPSGKTISDFAFDPYAGLNVSQGARVARQDSGTSAAGIRKSLPGRLLLHGKCSSELNGRWYHT